jgi:hypothetical protein
MFNNYQIIFLDVFRIRDSLSLFGFILVDYHSPQFVYTGKWFKFVKIKEQKIKYRFSDFDDGWSYQYYWKEWEYSYRFIEIIK